MNVFFVGDSHLGAVVNAYHARVAKGREINFPPFVWLAVPAFNPPLIGPHISDINPVLLKAVRDHAACHPLMVLSVAGNHHNVLGLLNPDTPFDFVLPSEPELPLLDDRAIVPARLIEATLRELVDHALQVLKALVTAVDCRTVHLESPPPIFSSSHITQHADEMFRARIDTHGVSPPLLRYKLWRLHSALFAEACREVKCEYLPAPRLAMDAAGFLVQEGWGSDATHANAWYGEHLLSQIDQLTGRSADDSSTQGLSDASI